MKAQTLILAVLFLLSSISFFPGNSIASISKTEVSQTELLTKSYFDYKYVRVFDADMWWIYVYDGDILIDVYPEE